MFKVAVIGAGNWGKNLIRTFNCLGVLWGFADPFESNRKAQQELYPDAVVLETIEQVIEKGEVNAVAIATPAPTHFEVAKKALNAGLHVFVEKPITLNTKDAEKLVKLAKSKGLILMVGHVMLYHSAMTTLKKLVDKGELGRLLYAYGQRLNLGKVREDENAMWSLAPHDISMVLHLFGEQPTRVAAFGSTFVQPEKEIEDVVFMNLLYDDGRMAHIHTAWLDPTKTRKMIFIGDKKMAIFDDGAADNKLQILNKSVFGPFSEGFRPDIDKITLNNGDATTVEIDTTSPLELELAHFIDAVENGKPALSDGQNGLDVLRVLEAAQKSLKQGGSPVEIG